MPRGGRRANSGRRRGSKNKATIEKAIIAERDLAETQASGKKLAKEVIEDLMNTFVDLAAYYRPVMPGQPETNRHADKDEFEKHAIHAFEMAKALAPYQSPTFRAVMVAPPPSQDQAQRVTRFTFSIFDGNRRDGPPIIEHDPPVPLNAAE
jgi:hypothetical protein